LHLEQSGEHHQFYPRTSQSEFLEKQSNPSCRYQEVLIEGDKWDMVQG